MEHEHFSYPEAIKFLANKYNIEIEETSTNEEKRKTESFRKSLFGNQFAQENFSKICGNHLKVSQLD